METVNQTGLALHLTNLALNTSASYFVPRQLSISAQVVKFMICRQLHIMWNIHLDGRLKLSVYNILKNIMLVLQSVRIWCIYQGCNKDLLYVILPLSFVHQHCVKKRLWAINLPDNSRETVELLSLHVGTVWLQTYKKNLPNHVE